MLNLSSFSKKLYIYKLLRMGITKHDILGYTTEDQDIAYCDRRLSRKNEDYIGLTGIL